MKRRCWLFHPKVKVNSYICPKSTRMQVQVFARLHEIGTLASEWQPCIDFKQEKAVENNRICIKGDTTYLLSAVPNAFSFCSKWFWSYFLINVSLRKPVIFS